MCVGLEGSRAPLGLLWGPSAEAGKPLVPPLLLLPLLPLLQANLRKKAILDFSGFAFADDQKVPAVPADAPCLLMCRAVPAAMLCLLLCLLLH